MRINGSRITYSINESKELINEGDAIERAKKQKKEPEHGKR